MKAIVLPLIVVFCISASVGVAQTFTSGAWTYTLNGANEATITGYSGPGGAVNIPGNVNGNPVKHVGAGMFMNIFGGPNASVTSVAIPDGVMAIELSAFADSTALTSVTLPATLKSIGVYAFSGCTALSNLAIPHAVINIDAYAFQNCSALTSLEIPESVQTIWDGAFSGCTGLTNVVIPSRFTAQIGTIGFTGQLATDLVADGLVEAIAQRVLAALPDNYGIATKADLANSISNTTTQVIAQVQAAPNEYNLFSAAQYEANRITGVAEGKAEVTSNPSAFDLYTSDSIMDLRMGGLMIQKQGTSATVFFQPQSTTEIASVPFADNGPPIIKTFEMPGDKGFLRVQALAAAPDQIITVEGGTLPQSSQLAGTVVETFRIGKYEVTWSEWQEVQAWAVVNGYPDLEGVGEGASSEHPVMLISCYDAAKWSNAKSEKEGLTPVYLVSGQIFREGGSPGEHVALDVNTSANGYRLPTEAEWEWAARGGRSSQGYTYSGSDDADAVAWYGDWGGGPKAVGTKTANELGIYDMSGNAWEWVYDAGRDPTWLRGGHYLGSADYVAVGSRVYMSTPSYRHDGTTGFRFARNSAP